MKAVAAILLVCIVNQNVCAFLSPFTFVPGRRGEKAYKVEKHVNKASKTMNEHGERLMEYKKAINETLTQGKEQLKKLWNENKDHWSSKAEAEWLKFRNRAEEGLEQVKEGVYGIQEILDTNLPDRPRAVMKAMIKELKDLVLAVKEIYKQPKSQGNEEQERLLQEEVTEEGNGEPQTTDMPILTTEPEVYSEEYEPTEELKTRSPEESLGKDNDDEDWLVGPEGDGLVIDKEIPDESDEETPQESDEDEYEDKEPIIEEGETEAEKEVGYTPEEEAEKEERENDEDDANSSEDESGKVSPFDFFRKQNREKLGGVLKTRAKLLLKKLFAKRRLSDNGSEKP